MNKLFKIGFGKLEGIKSLKSAGLAGSGVVAFTLIGDLLPGPLSDPVVAIPLLTWGINFVRKLVMNNESAE